jgi:C4-dicarboxylate transporter DctM subunit
MIFMIFIGADLMNSALALTQVPDAVVAAVVQQLGTVALLMVIVCHACCLYILLGFGDG